MTKCKDCGAPIHDYEMGSAYCEECKIKRRIKCVEIDSETGLWEGEEA